MSEVPQLSELYTNNPDVRIAGSFARAAWYGRILRDPSLEFFERGEQPHMKSNGDLRDIDVLPGSWTYDLMHTLPVIDTGGFSGSTCTLLTESDQPAIVSGVLGEEYPLEPEVFEVFKLDCFGVTVQTFAPETLLQTFGLQGELRQKDVRTKMFFEQAMATCERKIPEELFLPFDRFRSDINKHPVIRCRNYYRRYVPEQLRAALLPIARKTLRFLDTKM